MTRDQYLSDKTLLDDLNHRIDEAPLNAKPVFQGIVTLYDRVKRYERKHRAALAVTNG